MADLFTNKKFRSLDLKDRDAGQTLIETLVAAFILVMGITAAVGLAIYAYSSSTNITKQIIATGLAREGLEAVRNARDTNWLKLTIDKNCYNFASSPIGSISPAALSCPGTNTGGRCCFKNWLDNGATWASPDQWNKGYNFDLTAPATFAVSANYNAGSRTWVLTRTSNFGLNLETSTDQSSFSGFYVPNLSGPDGSSEYYRSVTITAIATPPFDTDTLGMGKQLGPKLKVLSQVWWTDKKCPRAATFGSASSACRLQLETELTNWKNY